MSERNVAQAAGGLLLLAVGAAAAVLYFSWPVSTYGAAALLLYLIARTHEHPIVQAARSLLLSATIGFGILTGVFLALRLLLPPADAGVPVSAFELAVHRAAVWLPAWSRWSVWRLTAALVPLVLVNRLVPSLRLVSRFFRLKRFVARTASVISVMTSFSFMTSEGLLANAEHAVEQHVSIVYARGRSAEQEQLARFLALKTESTTIRTLPPGEREYIVGVARDVSTQPGLATEGKHELAGALGDEHVDKPNAGVALLEPAPDAPPREALTRQPETLLAEQADRLARATALADAEERQAVEEIAKATRDLAAGEMAELGRTFLDHAFGLPVSHFLRDAGTLLEKVGDRYLDRFTDPVVSKYARALQRGIHQSEHVVRTAIARRVELARELADRVAVALADANPRADSIRDSARFLAALSANETVESSSAESVRLRRTFGPAAAQLGLTSELAAADQALAVMAPSLERYKTAVEAARKIREQTVRERPDLDRELERGPEREVLP